MKVYVASSWRNKAQPLVVKRLRSEGHEVYDFRHHPGRGDEGFHWSDIDPQWESWDMFEYLQALDTPLAQAGFASDMTALEECDAIVLVMPCGRSAHLELGWAVGAGKKTFILLNEGSEPELMYKMVDAVCTDLWEVLRALEEGPRDEG